MNLVALADENLRLFGEYPFLMFEDSAFTNRQMLHDANALSKGMTGLGVKAGDKTVVMLPNCPEVLVSYQGILRCGAVIVPAISMMTEQELEYILVDCEAAAIITSRDIFQKYEPMLKSIETLKRMIILDDHGDDRTAPDGALSYRFLLADPSPSHALPDIREEDLAVILYTAGTTSTPKGVVLTHKNLYSNAINAAIAHGTKATDITLVALPLSHSFGITTMNKAYKYGNLHVLMRKFHAGEAFRLIEKYKVTDMPGVPAMFTMMLNSPESIGHDLSSWKSCLSAGAPFPLANMTAFQQRFNCKVFEAYGLSEASPAVSTNYHNRPTKPGSIGQPMPDVEVRIVDDQDRNVPSGTVGELLVRGPNVSSGYYKLPAETAKTFKNGWLHTGDMAKMDEDGYLYLVERKKDLIIRGGFNIYPRDIEETLYKHPSVQDAVAIGVPDPVMGEEIKVYIVLKEGAATAPQEILRYCQDQLAKHKWPKHIDIVKTIPRNPMGKILRKELRKLNDPKV
jgi:long-chain acyl-CoA synthetase